MLKLEPFWVYASVAFLVLCGRRQLVQVSHVWGNHYCSSFLVLIAAVFAPVENWIMLKHTDWETTFILRSAHDTPVIALASCLHVTLAIFAYGVSMFILNAYGEGAVMKSAMWAFSIFFSAQGMFYDCLMYSGTFDEYHAGVIKSFWSFFLTDRFCDAYIIFSLLYGPPFFAMSIYLNSGCKAAEKRRFIEELTREALLHAGIICGVYIFLYSLGMLPAKFGIWRLVPTLLMHFSFHLAVIAPQFLCSTQEVVNGDTLTEPTEYKYGKNGYKECTLNGEDKYNKGL